MKPLAVRVSPTNSFLQYEQNVPLRFQWAVAILCAACALLWAVHAGIAFWASNEVAPAESIVALQSMMLANDGGLYYANRTFPYTITAYMPLFYFLEALLFQLGIPALIGGRLLSMAAACATVFLVWRIVELHTRSRYASWIAALLCAYTSTIPGWAIVGRVDPLALMLAIAAFHQYTRYATGVASANSLHWAAAFAIGALMTKQTMAAGAAAIFILLWFRDKKASLMFAATVGGAMLVIGAAVDWLLQGRFLFNIVFANINPFGIGKLYQHAEFFLLSTGMMILIIALGGWRAVRDATDRGPFVYLILAMAVLAATAGKLGSDTNYHLESTVLLAVCSGIALHRLEFFPHVFRASRAWVTLLQVPLLVHMVNNVRITVPAVAGRIAIEKEMRAQGQQLQKYLQDPGPVLSMDFNVLLHSTRRLDVEPLIYNWLVRAGRIDPEPLRRDIAARKISTIVLHDKAELPSPEDLEIPSLPEQQLAEIRKHYRLVDHIQGPYFGGVYVYKPLQMGEGGY